MNRNTESHFAELPQTDIQRSRFDRSADHKTSFNFGQLIPFFWDEVLPGDTFDISTSIVARLQTLLTPIMDNAWLDTYYFFVPNRIIWSHWPQYMGENSDSAWIPQVQYNVPVIESPEDGWDVGTIADYMGIPVEQPFTKDSGLTPIALPFRAYAMICDEWFRDENLSDPLQIPLGDEDQEGSNGSNYITDVVNGGAPFIAAKAHDYFSSCLPSPQRGPSVNFNFDVPATISVPDYFPVNARNKMTDAFSDPTQAYRAIGMMKLDASEDKYAMKFGASTNYPYIRSGSLTVNEETGLIEGFASGDVTPINLWASSLSDQWTLSNTEFGFTINELRLAFQLQKYYEKLARGGCRYREVIKVMFNTTSPDARMMIPEYLGGKRVPISIKQIDNQTQGQSDFLGDVGANSLTVDYDDGFTKSFTEHGIIVGVCVARYSHSFPQGLSRDWIKNNKFDYYWPVFANIGEQPVYKYEIDASVRIPEGEEDPDYEERMKVFGYNEAFANYRFKPDRVSAEMRPGISNSLASWHLADYYEETPSLSDEWIREDKSNVDRVLAVTSQVSNQLFADIYVKNYATRPMPMFSIPGLIDHH